PPRPVGCHRRAARASCRAMKRVLVVQHEEFEGPGSLRSALQACELRVVRTFAGEPVPGELAEDGLVVLGGGMGVYESDRFPPLQAFRAGARAWGIQFHLETDAQVLEAMLASGEAELREAGADAAQIRDRARDELPKLVQLAETVFGRWAALL